MAKRLWVRVIGRDNFRVGLAQNAFVAGEMAIFTVLMNQAFLRAIALNVLEESVQSVAILERLAMAMTFFCWD